MDLWQSPKSKPHILKFLSADPVTINSPSDEISIHRTGSLWPYKERKNFSESINRTCRKKEEKHYDHNGLIVMQNKLTWKPLINNIITKYHTYYNEVKSWSAIHLTKLFFFNWSFHYNMFKEKQHEIIKHLINQQI